MYASCKVFIKKALYTLLCLLFSSSVYSHGGVALIDDVCVLSLGNLSAHFAAYQPRTQQSTEFCEDIPDVSESIFVIDFIHKNLGSMSIDFRIVRDVNNVGLSAVWEDVEAIDDLDMATEYYQPGKSYTSGSMQITYTFKNKGTYIGVMTAYDSVMKKQYRAVFPFRVGAKTFWDYLPFFLGIVVFLEIFYWVSNGGLQRLRAGKIKKLNEPVIS